MTIDPNTPIHPVLGSIAVAGIAVSTVASFLGTWANLLRDRYAEAYWFATSLGIAMMLAGIPGFGFTPSAQDVAMGSIGVAGLVGMWVIARRSTSASRPAAIEFARWEAASWSLFLPFAAAAAWIVLVPVGWVVVAFAGSRWLVDQCTGLYEVDLESSQQLVCDAARKVIQWWWLVAAGGASVVNWIALALLVPLAAPRGARWRLVGFLVLLTAGEWLLMWKEPWLAWFLPDLPWLWAGLAVVAIAAATWAAFRPLRPSASPATPPPAGSRWRRGAFFALAAGLALVSGIALAYVAFTGSARRSPAYDLAVERVLASEIAKARLDRPIRVRWWISGSTNVKCDTPTVALAIPVEGPRGTGRLKVFGVLKDGSWKFSQLDLLLAPDDEVLDLRTDAERAERAAFMADAPRRKAMWERARAAGFVGECIDPEDWPEPESEPVSTAESNSTAPD